MANNRARKRAIRALAAELGVNYMRAMRILDEREKARAEAAEAETSPASD